MPKDRDQATRALHRYRADHAEADAFSRTIDARAWEERREQAEDDALQAGLTEAEIEAILEG